MLVVKFILGMVPIIWLIIALTGLKMPGYKACSIAIVFAAAVALFYKHLPVISVATAFLEGVLSALWPIILVILAALFVLFFIGRGTCRIVSRRRRKCLAGSRICIDDFYFAIVMIIYWIRIFRLSLYLWRSVCCSRWSKAKFYA